ncbi:MAG: hypothetical protein IJ782_01975 [Prevotella sp.]|nr:hypothetical protein [Prevotella sp.]
MATESRNILKSYFKTGKYPTEGQFAKLVDSFVHKNDLIGMSSIEGLAEALNGKADKATIDLKDYAEAGKVLPLGGCYLYYGMPTHARTLDALDTDFDPEATEGDTTQVVVFCCGHSDGDNSGKGALYLVYGSTNSGYAYYASFTHQNVPEDILRAFGEAVATTYADGLMSKKDKEKLDKVKVLDIAKFCRSGGELPQEGMDCNIFMHNGKLVEMRQWDSNSQKFMAFATLSLGDVEEKALGTAPMEYRQSYYVFRDDDNGYYEYLTAYGYSNVPMNIARAFHGEETSEAVNDIFSI